MRPSLPCIRTNIRLTLYCTVQGSLPMVLFSVRTLTFSILDVHNLNAGHISYTNSGDFYLVTTTLLSPVIDSLLLRLFC